METMQLPAVRAYLDSIGLSDPEQGGAQAAGTKYVIGRISLTQDDWVLRGSNIFMNSTPLEYTVPRGMLWRYVRPPVS